MAVKWILLVYLPLANGLGVDHYSSLSECRRAAEAVEKSALWDEGARWECLPTGDAKVVSSDDPKPN